LDPSAGTASSGSSVAHPGNDKEPKKGWKKLTDRIGRGFGPATDHRRYDRMVLPKSTRARLKDEDGTIHEVEVQDISAGGAGLLVDGVFDNDSFVEMHMEGLGDIKARVARNFIEGIGIEFDLSEPERNVVEAELRAFRNTIAREEF
jgi:hypothetical protein